MHKIQSARIKALREHKDWSQSDLEQHSGVVQAHISRIETNKAPNAAGIILAKLAIALETTTDYLLGLTDDPSPRPVANHPALVDPLFREFADSWPDIPLAVQEALLNFIRAFFEAKRQKQLEED